MLLETEIKNTEETLKNLESISALLSSLSFESTLKGNERSASTLYQNLLKLRSTLETAKKTQFLAFVSEYYDSYNKDIKTIETLKKSII